jgi:hypothetical protein
VLGAAQGGLGAGQGLAEGELVGLGQRHLAVVGDVGPAAQARDQVVGEEGGADLVGLLRGLALGGRRKEGGAFHVGGLVHEEGGLARAALGAGDGPRGARVEDGHAHVHGQVLDGLAQAGVGVTLAKEQQPLVVGVARVIDDELLAQVRAALVGEALLEGGERGVERGAVRV